MNFETRLQIINKLAYALATDNPDYFPEDIYWMIGMLSDTRLNDEQLNKEIEHIKTDFPDLAPIFSDDKSDETETLMVR